MNAAHLQAKYGELLAQDTEVSDDEDISPGTGDIQTVTFDNLEGDDVLATLWQRAHPANNVMGMYALRRRLVANGEWGALPEQFRHIVDAYCDLPWAEVDDDSVKDSGALTMAGYNPTLPEVPDIDACPAEDRQRAS